MTSNIYQDTLVCGLTGSIAVGKSTVARFIEKQGYPQIDADQVARDVVVVGSDGLQKIVNQFGSQYLHPDGTLNREMLGGLVFNDLIQLGIINKIMFPMIQSEVQKRILNLKIQGHKLIFYNAALIIEQGNADKFRPLVVVVAPANIQLTRLMSRNNLSEVEARARIDKQLSSVEKAAYADFIIETIGTLDELESKTISILSEIKSIAGREAQDNPREVSE